MNLKKKSFVLFLVLAFLAGFGLDFLIGGIGVERNLTGGDVSKASRYNKARSDVQLSILQEKLQNDKEYFNQTKEVSSFLLSRVNTLADLTERSIGLCSGIEEFKDQLVALESLNAKAGNTGLALEDVRNGLEMMGRGQDVPDYEQAYNDAVAGFLRIERQLVVGKSFVESAGKYLEDNENAELVALVSDWAAYCYQDATLNGAETEMTYWNGKYNDLSGDVVTDGLNPELLSGLNVVIDCMDGYTHLEDQLNFLNLDQNILLLHKPTVRIAD